MATWRVGNHQPQNLYRGDEYMGVMFSPVVAEFVCEAMNGQSASAALRAAGERLLVLRDSIRDDMSARASGRRLGIEDAARCLRAYAKEPESVTAVQETETSTDHTPLTMVQEIQTALVNAGLDIRLVAISLHLDSNGNCASIICTDDSYSTDESNRLAQCIGGEFVYREQGKPKKRIGILHGETRNGIRLSIHCTPRMTAEEVAKEASNG